MYIFRDRHGQEWITAEGVLRYFGVRIVEWHRRWYLYDWILRRFAK